MDPSLSHSHVRIIKWRCLIRLCTSRRRRRRRRCPVAAARGPMRTHFGHENVVSSNLTISGCGPVALPIVISFQTKPLLADWGHFHWGAFVRCTVLVLFRLFRLVMVVVVVVMPLGWRKHKRFGRKLYGTSRVIFVWLSYMDHGGTSLNHWCRVVVWCVPCTMTGIRNRRSLVGSVASCGSICTWIGIVSRLVFYWYSLGRGWIGSWFVDVCPSSSMLLFVLLFLLSLLLSS